LTVDQATRLRELVATSRRRARVVAVTSGKGGVGKSNLALNSAIAAARHNRRVVLIDADLGLANLDVMAGITAASGLAEVISGRKRLYEVAAKTPYGIELVAGASGIAYLADLPDEDRLRLLAQMEVLEREADLVIIDTGAGVSRNVVKIAAAADEVLVVTTPEPTSITDAYAAVKLISREREHGSIGIVVNQAASSIEARRVAERIAAVGRQFLRVEVQSAGYVLSDHHVGRAVRMRRPFLAAFPACPASLCVSTIARRFNRAAIVDDGQGFMGRLRRLFGR
jgi:flagellar biosynthesis protein FlhG